MLIALELSGFKSFADDTRFDFPPGITIVVGPNGSGKSNIVDAMKWVLGEQSARSLRGKEMADVIFKGSGTGGRKPANTAEATIVFENRDNIFGLDAEEVHVTRRVYRSGEGEYLINNQACRLKDIKDMFRGTGVGTDAYSLIEQGKVDSLLQASPRDRRAIFEEAAGISRFKAKKIEAQRRLERVEQNLLRLSDIVDEVDDRLRRLKSQASKARRFKEYSDRLQALRTQVGRVDWQALTARLEVVDHEVAELQQQLDHGGTALEAADARFLELETAVAVAEEQLRDCESRSSRYRERIAARQSTVEHERTRSGELHDELDRFRRQLLAMTSRAGDLQAQWQDASFALEQARRDQHQKTNTLKEAQQQLEETTFALDQIRQRTESRRVQHVEQMRLATQLNHEIAKHQSLLEASADTRQRAASRRQELLECVAETEAEADGLEQKLESLQTRSHDEDEELQSARAEKKRLRAEVEQTQRRLHELRQQRAVAGERMALLQEFEARMEGVASGVQELLAQARAEPTGPWNAIRGMVADLIEITDPEMAEMISVALDERAQHLVMAGTQWVDMLSQGRQKVPGRVGFLRLHSSPPPRFLRETDLDGQTGVIGRADRFLRYDLELEHLVEWLLGDTWLVETLDDAVQFHRCLGAPPKFVTRNGEVLDRDGRLQMGPQKSDSALIPRRAELGSLKQRITQLDEEVGDVENRLSQVTASSEEAEKLFEEGAARHHQAQRELAELQLRAENLQQRRHELARQSDNLAEEERRIGQSAADATTRLAAANSQLSTVQQQIDGLEESLAEDRAALPHLETRQQVEARGVTAAEVALAKSEQRGEALQVRCDQLQRDQKQRDQAIDDARDQATQTLSRCEKLELNILVATAEIAELSLMDEATVAGAKALLREKDSYRAERSEQTERLSDLRHRLHTCEKHRHLKEIESERIRHERQGLEERLQEDYGIQVTQLAEELSAEEQERRAEVDAEIADLRRKITNLGSVNMDALEELTDLETRHHSLASQYQDLVDAKESLERIIQKINADSRRLFSETLEAIRVNFQALFRKVFGGGQADVVLEEGVDILESGIDIVATPPGKHSLGLSLLSGGERALTAVTLLLAIFEYRPSPFCVLDEVDGPLDEANIGRFIEVLREFLKWTKFVVVTHSKKTMTAASTLYGVTMQESGVSKRVSVRFEDVNEVGEISSAALQRSGDAPAPGDEDERGAA